jgi:hypothetical protein
MIIASIFYYVLAYSNNDNDECQYIDVVSYKHFFFSFFFFGFTYKLILFFLLVVHSYYSGPQCNDDFPFSPLSLSHSLIIVVFFAFSVYRIKKMQV